MGHTLELTLKRCRDPVPRQDQRVPEAHDELVRPLTPTTEVHTRAERATLELPRVLPDLVAMTEGASP
jgi:hypothetical protein